MRWVQGRTVIEQMLATGDLQRVSASREHADRLLEQARRHVYSTQNAVAADPEGAYALLYDAARKTLTAILENQGLRPTSRGGHLAVYHAVRAQLDPPMGKTLLPFDRMRRRRHDVEYPPAGAPELAPEDVTDDEQNRHSGRRLVSDFACHHHPPEPVTDYRQSDGRFGGASVWVGLNRTVTVCRNGVASLRRWNRTGSTY